MIKLNVKNEMSRLRSVILGTAEICGLTPKIEECHVEGGYVMSCNDYIFIGTLFW